MKLFYLNIILKYKIILQICVIEGVQFRQIRHPSIGHDLNHKSSSSSIIEGKFLIIEDYLP